ncbi:EAL domain-containing protein [Bradyrhizobium barranii]|uniref:EAL domain-containing protein n=1 Tax=Bradyrhizobium barranii TaxID=2992140 RepID=UPI0024C0940D|nr:EAL domain-containing protein [Bradyrhizobium japonicum]
MRPKKTMQSLKGLGILIALDDFGTGYSSLSYAEAFPLDTIKVDRSFVASLGQSERSLAIVRAAIGLAHGLGVPVLAEGIKTKLQMSLLVEEGCDEMQGYLIGRPQRLAAEVGPSRGPISNTVGLTGEIAAGSTKLSSAFGIRLKKPD